MREALTETYRKALAAAQVAARQLKQDFVSTEHFFLGLLDTDGEATHVLKASHGNPRN